MKRHTISAVAGIFIICFICAGTADAAQKTKAAAAQPAAPKVKTSQTMQADVESLITEGKNEEAIETLTDIVAEGKHADIQEWGVLRLYSLADKKSEKVQEIVVALESKLQDDTGNVPLKRAIAEGYVRLKDWGKVARIYEGLYADAPTDHTLKVRLIDSYILAGEADRAVPMLEPIVQQNPNDRYFSDLLLNAYVAAGMKDKALALYQKRVAAKPNSAGLRGRYAQTLQNYGLLKESLVQWKKAAELDPSNPFFGRKIKELTDLTNPKR